MRTRMRPSGGSRYQEVVRDPRSKVAQLCLEAIEELRQPLGAEILEASEVEAGMQLPDPPAGLVGAAVGHRGEVRLQLVQAAVHALGEIVAHQEHFSDPLRGHAVAIEAPEGLEGRDRPQEYRPLGSLGPQALAAPAGI